MSTPEEFCKTLPENKREKCQNIIYEIMSSQDKAVIQEKIKELSRQTGKRLDKVVEALESFT
jgi:hypothetical protein